MKREKSREIALCGMMTALAVVILCLGGLIPAATFCCPVLASCVLLPILPRWGRRDALCVWGASAAAALAGTMAASRSVIRNMETQTFFMEHPPLYIPLS